MKLMPIGARIIVRPLKKEEKEEYKPFYSEEESTKIGFVMWCGELSNGTEIPLEQGQKVIYKAGDEELIKSGNDKYFVVKYSDLLVIVKN